MLLTHPDLSQLKHKCSIYACIPLSTNALALRFPFDSVGAGIRDNLPNLATSSSVSASISLSTSSSVSDIKLIASFIPLRTPQTLLIDKQCLTLLSGSNSKRITPNTIGGFIMEGLMQYTIGAIIQHNYFRIWPYDLPFPFPDATLAIAIGRSPNLDASNMR